MISGIYKLLFRDGSFYIGKSVDIPKRWKQHIKSLESGNHTKNMQSIYNMYGEPEKIILQECHPDHIDILEAYYINKLWNPVSILNSTKPSRYTEAELFIIEQYPSAVWDMSTFEHIARLSRAITDRDEAYEKLAKSIDASYVDSLKERINYISAELEKVKPSGFFAKLFKW